MQGVHTHSVTESGVNKNYNNLNKFHEKTKSSSELTVLSQPEPTPLCQRSVVVHIKNTSAGHTFAQADMCFFARTNMGAVVYPKLNPVESFMCHENTQYTKSEGE